MIFISLSLSLHRAVCLKTTFLYTYIIDRYTYMLLLHSVSSVEELRSKEDEEEKEKYVVQLGSGDRLQSEF